MPGQVMPKSLLRSALEYAVGLVALGLLVNWAWCLLSPFIPLAVLVVGVGLVSTWLLRRRRAW